MFYYCTSLTSIPYLDTSSVTNMDYMCSNCSSLITVKTLFTNSVTDTFCMFENCEKISSITFKGGFNTDTTYMFKNINRTGVFYHDDNDYYEIISSLPSTWTHELIA